MSTIQGIQNSYLSQRFETGKTDDNGTRQVSRQDPSSSPTRTGGVMSAIQGALKQMGLSMDPSFASAGEQSPGNSGGADTGTAFTAHKALYKFLHDLFTLMQDQSNATSSKTAYSPPMTTSIQDIIQALQSRSTTGSDTAPVLDADLNNLQSDFQNLITAIGGDSTMGSSPASLRKFLQDLESNLNQQSSSDINFVNTTA